MADNSDIVDCSNLFMTSEVLCDFDGVIKIARQMQASKLLLLSGKPVLCRVDGRLSDPLFPGRLHFNQTENLVGSLLKANEAELLDKDGAVEINYSPTGAQILNANVSFTVNVFYGDGAHNVIVFFD